MFMLSAFMIFRQLTMTYRASEWKASRQKELQIFLQTLKEDLEKANSAYVIQANGEASRIDPEINVSVNSPAFNSDETGTNELKSTAGNQPVAYFAIIKPGVEFSEFSNQTSGSWQGCSLVLTKRTLTYQRTGDQTRHTNNPIPIPGAVSTLPGSGVSAGGLFEPNLSNDFLKTVQDVFGNCFLLD